MRAKSPRPKWVALVLGAALLTTGCATLPPLPSRGDSSVPRAVPALREEPSASALPPPAPPAAWEPGTQQPLRRRRAARVLGTDVALVSPGEVALSEVIGESPDPDDGPAVPPGWPDLSSSDEELLAPLLACASPAEFIELQRGVDMARLVEALEDWSAVRLGALGPLDAHASEVLQRKRASFLLTATELYGVVYAEVFALFILHSSFDDELRQLLVLLARDKQLEQTLGPMEAVRLELERRGLKLSDFPDRAEQPKDVLRGLGRAARDALSTSPGSEDSRYQNMSVRLVQLPLPYQEALWEVERALMEQHFAPGNVALGVFDHLTFGVPLGFYHLAAGTKHGMSSLNQGHYEQATRELAPAALMVALYAGGKGMRYLSEARGAVGAGEGGVRLQVPELRLRALKEVVERLQLRLGEDGLGQLVRHLQAQREAAVMVGAGGEPAAVALYEARGNVVKAQAVLSQAKPEPAGPTQPVASAGKGLDRAASLADEATGSTSKKARVGKSPGGVASLVDEGVGLTQEVVEAKLLQVELESAGPRLPADVALLEQQRPALEAPPPGMPEGSMLWGEYVAYRERRLSELKAGQKVKGPLRWEAYESLRGQFARGLDFERVMVALLRADAALPRALRRFLQDFDKPRIETYVGVKKKGAGVRFADVLIIEEGELSGPLLRVETISFKSRNLSLLEEDALTTQLIADASEALRYYGETLNIRRRALKLRDTEVPVQRVRLIYEGGALRPTKPRVLEKAVKRTQNKIKGVEVLVQ